MVEGVDFIQNISAKVGSSFCGSASVLPLRHGDLKCMHNIAIVTILCAMKIPHELIPKEHTCDCRGGQARLGTSNGVAPSTVVTDCLILHIHPDHLLIASTPPRSSQHSPQITYSSPILSAAEVVFFPYIAALTDYSEHRKLVWLIGFALTQVTVFAVAIMWHDYVWFERAGVRVRRARANLI